MKRILVRIAQGVVPVLLIAAGAAAMVLLIQARPQAQKKAPQVTAPKVEVVEVSPSTESVTVRAMGTVKPARVMVLAPQVSGLIETHHASLVEGGFVSAGEELVRIDDRDYALAVKQARAQVSRAQLDIRLEEGRQKVALREWATMEGSLGEGAGADADKDLATRDPQIKAAKAGLSAARSAVDSAKLALSRTVIEAPFNALVSMESIEVGQLVGPQSQLARLMGTDTAWIEVAVPVDRLPWFAIPGTNAPEGEGALVTVAHEAGPGTRIERRGKVVRLLHELSQQGRMARVLVEVQDPFDLASPAGERQLPLLFGAFVHLEIEGRALEDAIRVPRTALRDGDNVWVVEDESKLRVRPVEIAWRAKQHVLVTRGLTVGDKVITSGLAAPVPGMAVDVSGQETAATEVEPPAAAPERGEP